MSDSSDIPLLPKSVNVNNFKYSEPKTLPSGSRVIYVTHNSQKLSIQTPIMRLPYGLGEGFSATQDKDKPVDNKKPPSYEMNVSFSGHDDNPKMKGMLDLMNDIQNKIKEDAFKNRIAWLEDDLDGIEAVVNKLFTPILKYDKDKVTKKVIGKYPPTMKLKVPYDTKTGSFQFVCQDMDGNPMDFKMIMKNLKGGRGKFIIQLHGIWFAGGKFGLTWKIVNAKLEGNAFKIPKFIEESDDEEEKKRTELTPEASDDDIIASEVNNMNINEKSATAIEESDDEEEESDDEDAPPPPPPKKGAAKKTTKK